MSAAVQTPDPTRPRRAEVAAGLRRHDRIPLVADDHAARPVPARRSIRVVTGADDLDSAGTLRAAIIATCPILLAGMGGLWSERAGVVNIGLEGQMILGTWGAAYFTYWYGPWAGLLGAAPDGRARRPAARASRPSPSASTTSSPVSRSTSSAPASPSSSPRRSSSTSRAAVSAQLTGLDTTPTVTVPGLSDAANALADKHWFVDLRRRRRFVAALTTKVSTSTSCWSSLLVVAHGVDPLAHVVRAAAAVLR